MYRFFQTYRVVLSCGFFLLLSLVLATINTRASYRVDPVGVIFLEVLHPLQLGVSMVGRGAEQFWERYISLWSLRQENEELRNRIAQLEKAARQSTEFALANRRLGELLALRRDVEANAIAAHVIGRSPASWIQTVVIDRGQQHGIEKGMAVLSPDGVVGQVVSVSSHAAQILLVSDPNSAVDVLIQRTRVRGIASGDMQGNVTLKYVERKEDIQIGDVLVTSGFDRIFPKGQVIGTVVNVGTNDGRMFQDVEVKLSADLARVEEVLVVPSPAVRAGE